MNKILSSLPYVLVALALFFLGVFFGMVHKNQNTAMAIEEIQLPEKLQNSSLVLTQVSPLGIEGIVQGSNIRISNGKEILEVKNNESFQFSTANLFKNIRIVAPKGTDFFASKRGKKAYAISDSTRLESMSPENLIFFSSQQEALDAGYTID